MSNEPIEILRIGNVAVRAQKGVCIFCWACQSGTCLERTVVNLSTVLCTPPVQALSHPGIHPAEMLAQVGQDRYVGTFCVMLDR